MMAGLRGQTFGQRGFERLLRRAIRAWCRLCAWDIEVAQAAPLPRAHGGRPRAGCIVAAAPHRAWVEPFLLAAAWPEDAARLVWVADRETATGSAWRRILLPHLGAIPVDPAAGR